MNCRNMNPQIDIKKSEFREIMNLPMKMMMKLLRKMIMNTHQIRNCSEPSVLENPR
jgi:hypothetical protein